MACGIRMSVWWAVALELGCLRGCGNGTRLSEGAVTMELVCRGCVWLCG